MAQEGLNKGMKVAIDGPAGAGKSTIARKIAEKLGIAYLDTGAMYRVVTLKIMRQNIALDQETDLAELLSDINIEFSFSKEGTKVFMDGEDVTEEIRSRKVNELVSAVSALPAVRHRLVQMQREIADNWGSVVMDGRDIGTVVLSDASRKIFLDASLEERAKRRWIECRDNGQNVSLEQIRQEISSRDTIDSNRQISPLKMAPDAFRIDTTDLNISCVVDLVIAYIEKDHPGER